MNAEQSEQAEIKSEQARGATFQYTYSAGEQAEIRRIREKYLPKTESEDKLARLHRLDASVTRTATAVSLAVGILGALLLGVGLCCAMIPAWQAHYFVPGIVVGLVGIAGIAAAYPLDRYLLKRLQAKHAPEILRLSEELMK